MKGQDMSKASLRTIAAASALLIAGLSLTGCTVNIGSTDHDMGMMSDASSEYTADDIMFMQMMIPHHQQAVDMGTLAETRASNSKVKALAAQIKGEQAPEIADMKQWLKDAGASMTMGHTMTMTGMLSDAQMAELEAASGAEFDRLYLEGMIAHHEGAIDMAEMVINSKTKNTHALGHAITDSQTQQIAYMKELLATL